MSHRTTETDPPSVGPSALNSFEDFEPTDNRNGPVKIIQVNDRVRELDMLSHQGSFVSDYSAVKATLSVSNLRLIKRRTTLPGRRPETRQLVSAPRGRRLRHSGRFCRGGNGCKTELSPDARGILCIICLRAKMSAERVERDAARKAAGTRVRRPAGKLPQLKCNACPRNLRAGRPAGLCFRCWEKRSRKRIA
jgi:hypothetical protein